MFFIGQIDDNTLCIEAPEGTKLQCHDVASFYIFIIHSQKAPVLKQEMNGFDLLAKCIKV